MRYINSPFTYLFTYLQECRKEQSAHGQFHSAGLRGDLVLVCDDGLSVRLCMHDYKSLCPAAMISDTLVNRPALAQMPFEQLLYDKLNYAIAS